MELKITISFVILIVCIILFYLLLCYKQYEGMSVSGCSIIGNPSYNSYCQSNKAVGNNSCASKCSTTVPGLGNVCCQSSCCLNNKFPPAQNKGQILNSNNFPISQNNEQILNDIQSLQKMEQDLFSSLETNTNLTPQQQEKIIEKMNQITNMRVNLYKTLNGVNSFYGTALNSSAATLKEQTVAIGIVESELNRSKTRLKLLETEKNNKIRLVEINDYYGDKYAEHSQLMKIIIFTLVPIIILAFLNNKGILPTTIYTILLVIISAIGAYYMWTRYFSIITRDNMNYQAYDFYFDPSKAPKGSSTGEDPWLSMKAPGTCVGEYCCSTGQTWSADLNQCVGTSTVAKPKSSKTESFITESMVSDILTQKQNGKYKDDVNIGDIEESQSYSFINK
jgi:hypothetical protein